MRVRNHCQVTIGSQTIVAGGLNSYFHSSSGNYILGGWGRGGTGGWGTFNTVFSLIEEEWTPLSLMSITRHSMACTAFKGEFYVMGGITEGGSWLNSTEILNLKNGQWRNGPNLPYAMKVGKGLKSQGCLYVIGGAKHEGKILKLNEDENSWEQVADTKLDATRKSFEPPITPL